MMWWLCNWAAFQTRVILFSRHHLVSESGLYEVLKLTVCGVWFFLGLLYIGFSACMFGLYSFMPVVIKRTSATAVNLSLLTADLYSLFCGLFLFQYKVSEFCLLLLSAWVSVCVCLSVCVCVVRRHLSTLMLMWKDTCACAYSDLNRHLHLLALKDTSGGQKTGTKCLSE